MNLHSLRNEFWRSKEWDALAFQTQRAYSRYLALLPNIPLADLDQSVVAKIHASLGGGAGNTFGVAVNRFMTWCQNQGHTTKQFKFERSGSTAREAWDIKELEHYFPLATTSNVALAMAIGFFTAQRLSDVLDLKWDQIDNGVIKLTQRKTGRELIIPIHPELQDILDKIEVRGEYVVGGRRIHDCSYRVLYRRLVPKYKPSFHGIRKAACVALAEGGATPHEIMSMSGHTTVAMVQAYTDKVDQVKMAKNAVLKMKR